MPIRTHAAAVTSVVLAHGVLAHGVLAHGVLAHGVLAHGVLAPDAAGIAIDRQNER